jgi:hypothetical protein
VGLGFTNIIFKAFAIFTNREKTLLNLIVFVNRFTKGNSCDFGRVALDLSTELPFLGTVGVDFALS